MKKWPILLLSCRRWPIILLLIRVGYMKPELRNKHTKAFLGSLVKKSYKLFAGKVFENREHELTDQYPFNYALHS